MQAESSEVILQPAPQDLMDVRRAAPYFSLAEGGSEVALRRHRAGWLFPVSLTFPTSAQTTAMEVTHTNRANRKVAPAI